MTPCPSRARQRILVVSLLIAAALSGCGSSDKDKSGAATSPGIEPTTSAPPPASIVGEWQRTQTCEELVGLLHKAGMDKAIPKTIAGDGWIPGVDQPSQIEDVTHPCQHAVARKHSHFFTAEGQFGSRDASGQQVDDDLYRLEGTDHVVIGDVAFEYRITGGDTIMFKPLLPECAPNCDDAVWSVCVAYEGYSWHRIG